MITYTFARRFNAAELLDRPGWAKDSEHVFLREHAISDDTAHFELLDGDLAKDSRVVYWSDGSVLSDDPAHFAIISSVDHYLYTKDSSVAHINGNPISGADPATLQVLQGAYARDDGHAFYFDQPIADATFRHSGHLKVPMPLIPRASIGWANQSTGRTPTPSTSSTRTSNARRTTSAPTTDRR